MLHNGAVIASSCLPIVATSLLRIDAAADQAPLSAQQQLFNAWVQRIADQRAWLLAWDEAVQACRTRFARDGTIRLQRLPFKPPKFAVQQHWHRLVHKDLRNIWLRRQIALLFGDASDEWKDIQHALYGA